MGIDLGPTVYSGTGVEKLMNETQKTPAPVVSDSLQVADTLVVKKRFFFGTEEGYLENRREERRKNSRSFYVCTEKGNLSRYG